MIIKLQRRRSVSSSNFHDSGVPLAHWQGAVVSGEGRHGDTSGQSAGELGPQPILRGAEAGGGGCGQGEAAGR